MMAWTILFDFYCIAYVMSSGAMTLYRLPAIFPAFTEVGWPWTSHHMKEENNLLFSLSYK